MGDIIRITRQKNLKENGKKHELHGSLVFVNSTQFLFKI